MINTKGCTFRGIFPRQYQKHLYAGLHHFAPRTGVSSQNGKYPDSLIHSIIKHQINVAPQADKLRTQQQLEQLQSRYVGTGHADTTKHEWASNLHRDSYASYVGHPPLLAYMAVGMGESREKVRAAMIEVSHEFLSLEFGDWGTEEVAS